MDESICSADRQGQFNRLSKLSDGISTDPIIVSLVLVLCTYTIYWLKQTLPLIKFVKISKISCFYFSMVLYFKTVYFPLISKIYNRKQTQGFDVAMGTIYFDQGIAFVNKLTSNVTFNLLFWSQRSLTMSDLSFLFGVYLKLEEIKDNKRHLLKRYCNPVARDYVKSNFNQILVTANNIKFKISWNGSFKWGF